MHDLLLLLLSTKKRRTEYKGLKFSTLFYRPFRCRVYKIKIKAVSEKRKNYKNFLFAHIRNIQWDFIDVHGVLHKETVKNAFSLPVPCINEDEI